MNICIQPGTKEPPDGYSSGRSVRGWQVSWQSSESLEVLKAENEGFGLALGTLHGPLRRSQGLFLKQPKTLGRDALASDGSFALVLLRDEMLVVVTDPAGSIPLYWADGPDGISVGTLVHHVARATGQDKVDDASAVDFLLHGTVCHPYTWFDGVQALPPGSVCTFGLEDMDVHTYWRPTEPDDVCDSCDVRVWAERLRKRVQAAVRTGLREDDKVRLFFSGGEDARAVLGVVPDSVECNPTTVLHQKNREYRLARRAARAQGYSLDWIQRPGNFYRASIPERIDTVGPGWDFRHTHIFGEVAEAVWDADVLLGGYGADTLFKTHYMTRVEKRLGRPDRLRAPDPQAVAALHIDRGRKWFRGEVVEEVRARRNQHHERVKEHRPRTAGHWHWLWPLRPRAYAQYMSELCIGPRVIEPFLFSQVYQLAARMPNPCRVNEQAFRQAFAEEMGMSGWLPTSSNRIPRLGESIGSLYELVHCGVWKIFKTYKGTDEWEQGSWSRDQEGWCPVRPARHWSGANVERLRQRLARLLDESRTTLDVFWSDPDVPDAIRVRGLTLGVPE